MLRTETYTEFISGLSKVNELEENVFCTDSAVLHTWVLNKDKTYESYVQSRLEKIRTVITNDSNFKLVPTNLNPADIGTRGLNISQLNGNKLWFEGPNFLKLKETFWPNLKNGDTFTSYKTEDDKHACLTSVTSDPANRSDVDSEYNVETSKPSCYVYDVDSEYNVDTSKPSC